MTGRAITYLMLGTVGAAICGIGGLIGLSGATAACSPGSQPSTSTSAGTVAGYDYEQLGNAAVIVSVGTGRGIPVRGQIIAVAIAIQESSLHNHGHLGDRNDHDSLGLFQQRPSQGWGTPEQIMDPVYASTKFYDKLLTIPGWETMPLTDAAQAVQRSAFGDRYARWETDAAAIVAVTTGMTSGCNSGDGMSAIGEHLPADFTLPANTPLPVAIAIWWALQQLGTPYHFGGSCTDPHSGDPRKQCDCSSLMQQAYRAAGIAIPRVTDDQQHFGTPVASVAELKPGDLVFIPGSGGTMDDPGHVGMYIGQGIIVQSPHTGDFVKLTKLDSWVTRIAKIRRIVNQE
ncbi:MAG TPA: C40 family peptidase [Candidatus Limnocylindrales bacterium]|nr:C40 family peptidase [Candidatus Limnocylindrales bacterium]